MPRNLVARSVRRALEGADQLLARVDCQEVLADFRDASDQTLWEVLKGKQVSAREYLRWISFADGRGSRACGDKGALAATAPGSRVVFICPSAFAGASDEEAEIAVIHEMLHSLGLGENPPRSRDITDRVRRRCGAARTPDAVGVWPTKREAGLPP
jgi:hypothetical protein